MFPVQAGKQPVTSIDLLIEGRHFLPDVDPGSLGHKALAVNLSDLAAMGAQPLGCLLGLSLPRVDAHWLASFSQAFHALADQAGCPLIGGDTTRSNQGVVISVTVFGQVDPDLALRRDAALPGDDIWVTGTLGAPHVALQLLLGQWASQPGLLAATRESLERPQPPFLFAQSLPGLAHAALDISDGLVQDLGHILKASQCGAILNYDDLPVDPAVATLNDTQLREALLSGGDVYQLCFTAPAAHRVRITEQTGKFGIQATRIGRIERGTELLIRDANGKIAPVSSQGFDHFR